MFSKIRNALKLRQSNDVGATATEYMIVLVLVAVLAIGVWNTFGHTIKTALSDTNDTVEDTLGAGADEAGDPAAE